eukprot:Opistho-2@34384
MRFAHNRQNPPPLTTLCSQITLAFPLLLSRQSLTRFPQRSGSSATGTSILSLCSNTSAASVSSTAPVLHLSLPRTARTALYCGGMSSVCCRRGLIMLPMGPIPWGIRRTSPRSTRRAFLFPLGGTRPPRSHCSQARRLRHFFLPTRHLRTSSESPQCEEPLPLETRCALIPNRLFCTSNSNHWRSLPSVLLRRRMSRVPRQSMTSARLRRIAHARPHRRMAPPRVAVGQRAPAAPPVRPPRDRRAKFLQTSSTLSSRSLHPAQSSFRQAEAGALERRLPPPRVREVPVLVGMRLCERKPPPNSIAFEWRGSEPVRSRVACLCLCCSRLLAVCNGWAELPPFFPVCVAVCVRARACFEVCLGSVLLAVPGTCFDRLFPWAARWDPWAKKL